MAFKTGFYRGRQNLPPCHLGCISDAASCRVNIFFFAFNLPFPKKPVDYSEFDEKSGPTFNYLIQASL